MKASELKMMIENDISNSVEMWWAKKQVELMDTIKERAATNAFSCTVDYVQDKDMRTKLYNEMFALGYSVEVIDNSHLKVKTIPTIKISWA